MSDRDRKEQREYENNVFYEVWRAGGNTDRINDDRVTDAYYDGKHSDDAARRELKAQRPKEPAFDEQYPNQEDYYE